jgi:methylated-DNA-[protein]-cysteine S-methyltransferase
MSVWTHFAPFSWLRVGVAATESGLCAVSFFKTPDSFVQYLAKHVQDLPWRDDDGSSLLARPLEQLDAYFRGAGRHFDVPLDLHGTPFQMRVWRALVQIPYGQTISYSGLAEQLGSPKGTRAVGSANGRNPIAIVVPCHRVIAAHGSLGGYAGGLDLKRWLLDLESEGRPPGEPPRQLGLAL